MRRDTAVGSALGLVVLLALLLLFLRFLSTPSALDADPADPPPPPAAAPRPAVEEGFIVDRGAWTVSERESRPEENPDPGATAIVELLPEAERLQREFLRDESWMAYPDEAEGPVVVGVLVMKGMSDPPAWVALEDVSDPARPDPSIVESLDKGRFRMTGFEPGRYRVRAKGDTGIAVYSVEFTVAAGEVADAGLLRLPRPGSIGGTVHDPAGYVTEARVLLIGRDPASLARTVLGTTWSRGREGFQLDPHEAGEFELAVLGEGGYVLHRGRTDAAGLAWERVYLQGWSTLTVRLAPAGDPARVLLTEVVPLDVVDLGEPPRSRALNGPGRLERLVAGRYRIQVRWTQGNGAPEREYATDFFLAGGAEETVEVPR